MDNYIVSARKYRPLNFESVVGQDSISKTLKNSVKTKQIAQAYLFCGPRGVGKTTCARIFAKTINCLSPTEEMEACEKCESCEAFNKMRSLNIHELDAASNNSVDDIRNLIDKVRIPPQIGKYSVYIIDEVHMLSSSAFNAFLKTLEEPPNYVVFILATTEKHKIIPTILSRCQIFDFNRIRVNDIQKRLEFVAQKENITAESDALQVIAQKADGAMRDALSIFDQIVSFTGSNITYKETIENLNVLDYEEYFKMTDHLMSGDYTSALVNFDGILNQGFEGNYFINGFATHFRNLLMCKVPKTADILEIGQKASQRYVEYAAKCSTAFLFNAINIANESDLKYKESQNKRLLIELALLKISKLSSPGLFEPEDLKKEEKKEETKTGKDQIKTTSETVKEPEQTEEKKKENEDKSNKDSSKEQESANKVQKKIKSYSLKDLTKTDKDESKKVGSDEGKSKGINPDEYGEDEFDYEKLKYAWVKYAETYRSKNQRIFAFLTQHVPSIKEKNTIELKAANNNIINWLEKIRVEITNFLIVELNNKNIKIEFSLMEPEQIKTKKTDEEKLREMIAKNPEIKNLKDRLNLDFL